MEESRIKTRSTERLLYRLVVTSTVITYSREWAEVEIYYQTGTLAKLS